MDVNAEHFTLKNLGSFNIILGKNGAGKSHLLKQLELHFRGQTKGLVRYITPERAGYLQYTPHIEQNMSQNVSYLENDRRKNQTENFKQQSTALYRALEVAYLRKVDSDRKLPPFSIIVDKINSLLDRIRIEQSDLTFGIKTRDKNELTNAQEISSGESELISLGIEILAFSMTRNPHEPAYLLLDEPDVHLHPDLQYRFADFIIDTLKETNITVIVATHSTAFLSAFDAQPESRVTFMRRGDTVLSFTSISATLKDILPVFGAHPLSNVYSERPILLLEGWDDERVWQQAIRSSQGAIKLYPCPVHGNGNLSDYEREANTVLGAIYDTAKGFSLRDRDDGDGVTEDLDRVVRVMLSCRASENLLLSDDVLKAAGHNWPSIEKSVREWIDSPSNQNHRYYLDMKKFADSGFDRKGFDLKTIRNILLGFFSEKPWEVAVGQAIANLKAGKGEVGPNSLRAYLGLDVCEKLLALAN